MILDILKSLPNNNQRKEEWVSEVNKKKKKI